MDDDAYRRARIKAAERETSVSALLGQFLTGLGQEVSETERLKREEAEIRASIRGFRGSSRLDRVEIHDRGR